MSIKSERDRLRRAIEVVPSDELPVRIFSEAAQWLRRPFTPEAVQFKVVEAWTDTDDGRPTNDQALSHATIAPYITARAVFARLNLVCPGLWSMGKPEAIGGQWWVPLRMQRDSDSAEYIEQWDLSDTYEGKARLSDAIKRTAVHFGVGESLYAVPPIELHIGMGSELGVFLRPWRDNGEPWLRLTRAGEEHCRDIYRRWLLARGGGIDSFGRPLDHGNLTMRGEDEGEGPPMPVLRPGEKRDTPARRGRQAPQPTVPKAAPATAAPIDPEEAAQAELDDLLTVTDGLATLRNVLNAGMLAQGVNLASQRLRTLRDAGDKRGLEAAVTRYGHLAEAQPD